MAPIEFINRVQEIEIRQGWDAYSVLGHAIDSIYETDPVAFIQKLESLAEDEGNE